MFFAFIYALSSLAQQKMCGGCWTSRSSDRTVQPPLFRDRISNCISLFRPNPNQTRHRITSFVSVLFGNLHRGWNAAQIKLGLPKGGFRQLFAVAFCNFVYFTCSMVDVK